MQLILSIDDMGIKKNMSSVEETNQNEKNIKTEILDSNLTSSPSPLNINEEDPENNDQDLDSSQENITNKTNGIASCDDASMDGNSSSKINDSFNLEDQKDLKPENGDECIDISSKVKTEVGDLSEECQNKFQDEESSSNDNDESSCEKELNSDIALSVKTEELNENDSNINEGEDVSMSENINEKNCQDQNVSIINKNVNEIKREELKEKDGQEDNISNEYENEDGIKSEELNETECQDENVSNFNKNENDSKDISMKQESCPQGKSSDKSEDDMSADNVVETKENSITNNVYSSDKNKVVGDEKADDDDDNDDLISDNISSCEVENSQTNEQSSKRSIRENATTCSVSDEVIDIADERDIPDSIEKELKFTNIDDKPTNIAEENIENQSLDDDHAKEKGPITIDDDIIDIADEKDSCDSIPDKTEPDCNILRRTLESDKTSGDNHKNDVLEPQHCNERSDKANSKLNKSESSDKIMAFKLSNTLDILSDDEEEEKNIAKPDSANPKQLPEAKEKQCFNIEEDDDIMVIDDESSPKEEKKIDVGLTVSKEDNEKKTFETKFKTEENEDKKTRDKGSEEQKKEEEIKIEKNKSVITKTTFPRSPLLSSPTLKSFKKNLAEMTREELEDFCILTIAEAVYDRSNLGELKSQLKILTQNFEDHKLKAKNLAKQNRDLQVVLKSIQEEQKKNNDGPITPLKITRSVGMQVLMTDKGSRKRASALNGQMLPNTPPAKQITPTANKLQNKPATSTNASNTKTPPRQTQQPIPVPRLVPAPTAKPSPNSSPQVTNAKSPVTVPNGVKTPTVTKPEKRTHSKMQQSGAVTVDLTDDEPPAKVVTRNFNSPVRCVAPQALLAPRSSLPMTSPRKVYIPISGQQAQNIRPGQHVMLKSVTGFTAAGRPRAPSSVKITASTPGQSIRPRIAQRHPAPLPELMKQYQPPNWKALPPAPELKLSKVENGIVISWKIDGYREENCEEIASYQLFAYQETSQPPNTSLWKKIGDVKALPLPMACTLTQFMSGYKYYFAVRAVDVKSRFGPFSLPGSILLLKN